MCASPRPSPYLGPEPEALGRSRSEPNSGPRPHGRVDEEIAKLLGCATTHLAPCTVGGLLPAEDPPGWICPWRRKRPENLRKSRGTRSPSPLAPPRRRR